jgi:hypothetical protein
MRLFHICTIANSPEQYTKMKSSFIAGGFDEQRCRYSLFDNSTGNLHDPYVTLNHIQTITPEPYIVFCHQDILLDQGHGLEQLLQVLNELEHRDPEWAIAGNAGLNTHYELVAKINDPSTPNWIGSLPQQVYSLDENFFVIKASVKIDCSSDLKGFHFYATDLCLNAILQGHSCYVIDFHLTHLSAGNLNLVFDQAKETFYRKWCHKFNFCYIQTTCTQVMILSRYKLLRYLGSRDRIKNLFLNHSYLHPFILPYRWHLTKPLFLKKY